MPSTTAENSVNAHLGLSPFARARLRQKEKPKYQYYNDMGGSRGNCTWGIGIKAHDGPCTEEELKRLVSPAEVEASFAAKIADAERGIRRRVPDQALTQAQFDALVSLAYNTGVAGAVNVFALVNDGKLRQAGILIASMIRARVKGKDGKMQFIVLRGLIIRRAEEAKPFFDADRRQ